MANYSYYKKLAEDEAGQGKAFANAAEDFASDIQIMRYSLSQLESEKQALEQQLAAQKQALEQQLAAQKQAFQASIRAAEETAKLEREAGILIGQKLGFEKKYAELDQAKQLIAKLRRAYFLRRMSRNRRLVRLLLPPMLRSWWDRRYTDRLVSLIAHSGQFDKRWYLDTYPDVARAGIDPIRHYLETGAPEGRNPNRNFDTTAYLADHPMLSVWGLNPFVAFIVANDKEAQQSQSTQAQQNPAS